jgi:hypothetical protein
MKISSKELRKELKKVWPQIGFMWVPDYRLWKPTLEQLRWAIAVSKVDRAKFLDDINDCDDFALQLNADIKRMRAYDGEAGKIPKDQWHPWAFGEVFGTKFNGWSNAHSANICMCREGIYLIEPQTDEIWEAEPPDDIILCAKF